MHTLIKASQLPVHPPPPSGYDALSCLSGCNTERFTKITVGGLCESNAFHGQAQGYVFNRAEGEFKERGRFSQKKALKMTRGAQQRHKYTVPSSRKWAI